MALIPCLCFPFQSCLEKIITNLSQYNTSTEKYNGLLIYNLNISLQTDTSMSSNVIVLSSPVSLGHHSTVSEHQNSILNKQGRKAKFMLYLMVVQSLTV